MPVIRMMMASMMINCLSEVVEERQCDKLFFRSDQYRRFSPLQTFDTLLTRSGSEHNPSSEAIHCDNHHTVATQSL